MPIVLLHDVEGPQTAGLHSLSTALAEHGLDVHRPEALSYWWPQDTLTAWCEEQCLIDGPTRGVLIGVGAGGQSALRAAYAAPHRWAIAAAVAPACDLGRWYGQGTELDSVYPNADTARQDEAPLHFNPLSRPAQQLVWCDPRDEACLPSALRVVSKCESSGVPVTSDLETEAGESRDAYVRIRTPELVAWLLDAMQRVPSGPDLPVVPPRS